jgi:5-methylcytosine-specific restriction endonuclease McrA
MMNIIGRYTSELQIEILFCNKHGDTRFALSGSKRKRWKCMECSSDYSYFYKKRKKLRAIEYKGGCCTKCGYNKSITALHFHHVNPDEKSFEITNNLAKKWETLKEELDKCILLCMNCHFEEHERIDREQRTDRKNKMKPNKNLNRKEMNYINSKKLGINPTL